MENAIVRVRNLYKSFGEHKILNGVDLDIEEGRITAVIGKSGTGKSASAIPITRNANSETAS